MDSVEGPDPPAFLFASDSDIHKKFTELEWQQRQRVNTPSPPRANADSRWTRVGACAEVAERNRYYNIEPWAANRVKLRVPEGVCDYINASHIELSHRQTPVVNRYIATQGPKEVSRPHFWHMIWSEVDDVGVIVMLTQTHENGKEKCFAYFPRDMTDSTLQIMPAVDGATEGSEGVEMPVIDGDFEATVELVSTEEDESIMSTVRTLRITVGEKSKTIYHYLFGGWPDFGIPEDNDRAALLKLIKETAVKAQSAQNPRIVHCSAGVGRSGSFIALDYLLGELSDGSLDQVAPGEDPIADCVNNLREQRMMMVQGENQFLFLYHIMRDLWKDRHGTDGAAAAGANGHE